MTERTDRQPITQNTLYYGDNLKILREYISHREHRPYLSWTRRSIQVAIIMSSLRTKADQDSEAQITAFEDTWHWNAIADKHTTN